MKDEIKEILKYVIDDIYQCGEYIDQAKKLEKVLDYITNLQARNKKAIEYIKQYREVYYPDEPLSKPIIQYGLGIYEEDFDEEKLLNILEGEDNISENLYKYTPEEGFRLVDDEDVKD